MKLYLNEMIDFSIKNNKTRTKQEFAEIQQNVCTRSRTVTSYTSQLFYLIFTKILLFTIKPIFLNSSKDFPNVYMS